MRVDLTYYFLVRRPHVNVKTIYNNLTASDTAVTLTTVTNSLQTYILSTYMYNNKTSCGYVCDTFHRISRYAVFAWDRSFRPTSTRNLAQHHKDIILCKKIITVVNRKQNHLHRITDAKAIHCNNTCSFKMYRYIIIICTNDIPTYTSKVRLSLTVFV